MEEIDDILEKYGGYGRTGRVMFKHYAYILVAKELGLDWFKLTHNQKIFLKADMIEQYAGTGYVRASY